MRLMSARRGVQCQFVRSMRYPEGEWWGCSLNVSVGTRWERFVEQIVKNGRYRSASEVVREGLRLVEERESKLAALRQMLDRSIEQGGEVSEEELDAALDAEEARLAREGL